jgi:nucleotide-binding universal stress UspA family protein
MSELAAAPVSAQAITRVELAVDSSPASGSLAAYVRDLLRPDMHVSVVRAVENPRVLKPQLHFVDAALDAAREKLRRDARDALERAAGTVSANGTQVDARLIDLSREGAIVADRLIADAHARRVRLLALGARQRHGVLRWLDTSVSQLVTRHAHCSMLIVPERFERRTAGPPGRIMSALDGSPASLHALRCGAQFAALQTELLAACVVDRAVRLFDIAPVALLERVYVAEGERALGHAATIFAHCQNAPGPRCCRPAPSTTMWRMRWCVRQRAGMPNRWWSAPMGGAVLPAGRWAVWRVARLSGVPVRPLKPAPEHARR